MRGIERRIAAGLDPQHQFRRLAVRQPLGSGGRRQGARGTAQSIGHRHRRAHLPRALRIAGEQALAGSRSRRRAQAAHALGEHRHQGPEGRAAICTSTPWPLPTPSTPCRRRPCWHSPRGAPSSRSWPRTAAMRKRCSPRFAKAGIDVDALAARLQVEGAESFVKSWSELMKRIADKSAALATA